MTVETATYISDLVSTNPAAGDYQYEGDDHFRLLKTVIKASFPNITGAMTATHTALNQAGGGGRWVLQATTTNSGTPSAIDFVNGTGGVIMDSTYDAHILDFTGFNPSTGAQLYLQGSIDAGSTWTAFGTNLYVQALTISAGTVAGAVVSTTNVFKLSGGKNVVSGGLGRGAGQAFVQQNVTQGCLFLRGSFASGTTASEEFVETHGTSAIAAAFQSPLTGLRLTWSTGTFAATAGMVRLFSRKVS